MNVAATDTGAIPAGKPRLRKMRWPFPLIWLVPLAAAAYAGYLLYGTFQDHGEVVTISFKDANGLVVDQSTVRYRGVDVGKITGLALSAQNTSVDATVQFIRSAKELVRKGSLFWVVRPELGEGSFTGLGTFISGPYIEMIPGRGETAGRFSGLERQPVNLGRPGLTIKAQSPHITYLKPGSPVYYRGIQVGATEAAGLNADGSAAIIEIFIEQPYERLVRTNSKFWTASGVDVNGGIFSGLELRIESLRSLLFGGIAFATPEDPGAIAKNGALFDLHEKPKDEWLDWTPSLKLPAEAQSAAADRRTLEEEKAILNTGGGKKVP